MSVIELKNINKVYHVGQQEVPVLFDLNLEVKEGEFISIMGPSGSGKSTLMNIIGCLDRPTSGSYHLAGKQVDDLEDEELSQIRNESIGFVFQSFHLLPDNTALQNISLPLIYRGISPKTRLYKASSSAKRLQIFHRCHHKPTELSGGQSQRVAVARALIGSPSLILADEPTGNLDSKTGQEIMGLFTALHRQGNTIVMITHDDHLAHAADRIVRIRDGKIWKEETDHQRLVIEPKETPEETAEETVEEKGTGKLKWMDLIRMSIREGLFSHPMRTFLTTLGVLFGVAAVIAMLAINEGARQKAIEQIQQMGLHNIRVRSLDMTQEEIREARQKLSFGLSLDDLESIKVLPTVQHAVPIRLVNAEISYEKRRPRGRILGTTPQYQHVTNFYPKEGRFLNNEDEKFFRRVCVLGVSIKRELFGLEQAIGKEIYLGSEMFTVIGIMQGKNIPEGVVKAVSSNDLNHDIYIPLHTAKKRFYNEMLENELYEISIMVAKAEQIRLTAQLVGEIIQRRHHKVRDYEIIVPEELLQQSRQTQKIFDLVMVCIASISLIVGGIGIMNIMTATVTERFREIGIRRAIGASRRDILKQFLLESLSISILGGILGVFLGWFGALLLSHYTGWLTVVSATSIFLGFGVSTAVGLVFGIYPAWKAALLDPIQALNTT